MLLVGADTLMKKFVQLSAGMPVDLPENERFDRRDIWRVTGQIIRDHPIIGVGLGAYPLVYTRYDPSSGTVRVEQAHNDYLQIVADAGVIGGVLALTFLGLLFARGIVTAQTRDRRKRALVAGALTGCFAIAVHSFVDFNLQVTSNAQLFLALAALATVGRSERHAPEAQFEEE